MENKATVWIDLTDLLDWKGHFSGIQRVVYAYSKEYEKIGARFFVYDNIGQIFREVGLPDLHEETEIRLTRRQVAKERYQKVTPRSVRKAVSPIARKTAHYTFIVARKAKRVAAAPRRRGDELVFSNRDTVVILGAGWHHEAMIGVLASKKEREGFAIKNLIHDILPITQPHLFDAQLTKKFTNYIERSLRITDVLVTTSKANLKDIEAFAKQNKISLTDKIITVRLGEDSYNDAQGIRPVALDMLSEEFIFSLGTLEVRKNHQLLYQAYKLANERGVQLPHLVIVGRPGWLARDFFQVLEHDKSIAGQITVIPGVPDIELKWLYDNCLFTVYPSLCEGWGLTISDAIGRGKLCLTGNVSSMPEVAGDMADYFSPYSTDECLEKIVHYFSNRKALKEKENSLKAYKPTTWKESFQQLTSF